MRVAVTAAGASLDAQVDPRFGRCPCFLVIDTESMDFEAIENPNVALGGGAGLQSGQLMAEKDVQIVLTGNCGPNAHQVLSAAGIQVIIGCSGMVCEVVERFKAGGFRTAGGPNVTSHFGVGGASSSPQNVSPPQQGAVSGAGMGMGRGRGMGRGGGRGMGIGRGNPGAVLDGAPHPVAQKLSREEELAMLKQQADVTSQGLREISERIKQLEEEAQGS